MSNRALLETERARCAFFSASLAPWRFGARLMHFEMHAMKPDVDANASRLFRPWVRCILGIKRS